MKQKFSIDPLKERESIKTKGLVYKYPGRVMVLLTMKCLSNCEFCTRKWMINKPAEELLHSDLDRIADFIKRNTEINEVVISGGDPLLEIEKLSYFLDLLESMSSIKVIRIHTKLPIIRPNLIDKDILNTLEKSKKVIYLSLHVNFVGELKDEVIEVIGKLRKTGVILYSQSVFIKGLNDKVGVLKELFNKLLEIGVRPYYIYHCDKVKGLENFVVPLRHEVKIMTELRRLVSGLAYPIHVIDGVDGKIPVPTNFWKFEKKYFKNFKKRLVEL